MADYYDLISREIAALKNESKEYRRWVYDRARATLAAAYPPLSETELEHERLALEDAIGKVEAAAILRERRACFWASVISSAFLIGTLFYNPPWLDFLRVLAAIVLIGTIFLYFSLRFDEQIERLSEQIKRQIKRALKYILWVLAYVVGIPLALYGVFKWLTTIPLWAAAIIVFPIIVLLVPICWEVRRKKWDTVAWLVWGILVPLVFVKDFGWSVTTEIEVFVGIWLLLIAIYVYRKQVGEWYTRHSRWVDVWTIRILFSVGIAYGVYLFGKEFDWSLTTEIAVYVGFWLLLLTNILPEYDWWDRIFHRNNAERAERQMRTAGIWICGLAASAIVGGIVGSRFDETSSLYGGTIYWLWGTLAGLLTFACVRLWATSAKTK